MEPQKYVYIVFASTPYRIGSIIRWVTHHPYNHVAVSFTQSLQILYSFARYHKNAPFYGGFVRESCLRYQYRNKQAKIKVCKVPVSAKQHLALKTRIRALSLQPKRYFYNLPSAIGAVIGKKYAAQTAYTCVEFIVSLLQYAEIFELHEAAYYSIDDLEKLLKDYVIYEGNFRFAQKGGKWGMDHFLTRCSQRYALKEIIFQFITLLKEKNT